MTESTPTPTLDDLPTRYLSTIMAREFLDFAKAITHKFDIGVEEVMIISCVVWHSTKDMVEEAYLAKEYGFEKSVLPTAERMPLSLKAIHTTLNMSRETTRRKLARIVEKGILMRIEGGYVFPAQVGEQDLTHDLRKIFAKNINRFALYYERFRNH